MDANVNNKLFLNISKQAYGGDTGGNTKGSKNPRHKKISVFDLNMNFIEEIAGLRETERKYNSKSVFQCCKGKIRFSKGFIFKYSDNLNINYIPKIRRYVSGKHILCFDLQGNFIKEYLHRFDASKDLKITRQSIENSLLNKGNTKNNFQYIFKYK